ncbi:calcium-dependent protein kinase 5-like isoform X4 [Ambystoma mexicanum]|uniref:calcium-dependent protein kinase 5-like isoform X4 n=1 Tax=Ambystoma mexicanum TaxID=8296 RepID=UPI0037E987E3
MSGKIYQNGTGEACRSLNRQEKNPLIEIMPRSSRTLGEGCCGKVRKGKYNGNTAAIKIVPLDETDKDHLNREYRIYKALNHKNVVKVLGPPEKHHDGWHIPLELIKGRTLEELIFSPGEQLSEEEKYCIILGMCKGLKYLHQNDVVHQDLKPNNIMVKDSTKEAVIIDLGLSKFIDYTESGSPFSTGSNRGFRQYAAPEARAGKIRSRKSDVWSMGKVIAEVLLEHGLDLEECTSKNVGNLLHGSKYADIVCQMLRKKRKHRVEMEEVVRCLLKMNTHKRVALRHKLSVRTNISVQNFPVIVMGFGSFLMSVILTLKRVLKLN